MLNDPLANALSSLLNAEKVGKNECLIKPFSKTIKNVLKILKDRGYVGSFQEVDDGKGGLLKVSLIGSINNCSVITPRHSIQLKDYEKFEKRFLPAKGFGVLIVSTSQGLMVHEEAKEKAIGGKLIAYCY
ncbi:30S ribosomal protein S8 [Nanoarchaeota archaeon]